MKRKIVLTILASLLFTCLLSYNNCGVVHFGGPQVYETEGGNPMNPTQASQEILFAICSILDRCQAQIPFNDCMSGVQSVSGIGTRLGLPIGVDDPFSALKNAENSGVISANLNATNTCVDTINNLSCTNPNVLNAYNAASSSPFSAVAYMIPMSGCGQVFAPPVQSYACTTTVFLQGVNNSPMGPAISASGLTYSVTPALPSGLSLNPNSGIISGTPTVVTPMTAYTVTAGGLSNVINIRTANGYLVNDLSDLHNVGPGCVTSSGTCTLRAAIEAVGSSPSANVIVAPQGTITLTLGTPLTAVNPMDIYGNCAQTTTVDGGSATEILSVINSGDISFNFLTIQNGANPGGAAAVRIANTGVATFAATIANSVIQNSSGAYNLGAVDVEGASVNQGINLTINNSLFYNNQSSSTTSTTGGLNLGANGHNFVQTTISSTTFNSNFAGAGPGASGAVDNSGTSLTISNSLFYKNSSSGAGGVGTIISSSVGLVNLTNNTFDSNSSVSGGSGVIIADGPVSATNCTFANNSGGASGVFLNVPSGNLANNLFYNNVVGSNCWTSTLTSLGGNLTDSTATDCGLTQITDIVNKTAQLSSLQNNGGPTQTMAILPTSPGIDAAIVANCPSTDQRGDPRHLPTSCDTGAYEHQP